MIKILLEGRGRIKLHVLIIVIFFLLIFYLHGLHGFCFFFLFGLQQIQFFCLEYFFIFLSLSLTTNLVSCDSQKMAEVLGVNLPLNSSCYDSLTDIQFYVFYLQILNKNLTICLVFVF